MELVKQKILPEEGVAPGVAFNLELEGLGAAEAELKSGEVDGIDPVAPSPDEKQFEIRLKELDLELSRQQYQSQLLRVQALELETRRDVRLKELEVELKTRFQRPFRETKDNVIPGSEGASSGASSSLPPALQTAPVSSLEFDISRQISLVPLFRESEVDTYFTVFERIATTLQWPRNIWTLLLQCKLVGKAQGVCSALTLEQSLEYDAIKAAVLRAYELVPEAYRQTFRRHVKKTSQSKTVYWKKLWYI